MKGTVFTGPRTGVAHESFVAGVVPDTNNSPLSEWAKSREIVRYEKINPVSRMRRSGAGARCREYANVARPGCFAPSPAERHTRRRIPCELMRIAITETKGFLRDPASKLSIDPSQMPPPVSRSP